MKFVEAEGVELMLLVIKGKHFARTAALKARSVAAAIRSAELLSPLSRQLQTISAPTCAPRSADRCWFILLAGAGFRPHAVPVGV